MSQVKKISAAASVVCGAMILAAWNGPVSVLPGNAPAGERACDFEIQARNTGTHDIYLDLYTSSVINYSAYAGAFRQLKIQNARVGANKILPPQRVTVNGRCNARRGWFIVWRATKNSMPRTRQVVTDRDTRVSSSTGRRVLVLGDVGKW